jgi:hypothetical protein
MTRLSENSVLSIKNKSFSVTAEVVVPDGPVDGTIIAQGGAIGGWSSYARGGRAKFADEGVDVGCETGTAVAPECDVERSAFSGQINWVEIKVGGDDHSHLLDPEDHIHVLMGRQ